MHLPWRDIGDPPIATSLTSYEAAELSRLAAGTSDGATEILEIGSAFGFSAVTLLTANPEARLTSIDPHDWCVPRIHGSTAPIMCANLSAYGVSSRCMMFEMTFFSAFPWLDESNAHYDLVFIDGDHSYETVKFDVEAARCLLVPGGTLVVHDYLETCCCPDVRRALDELLGEPPHVVDSLAVYEGIGPAPQDYAITGQESRLPP